jgi:hypothetical protein
MSYVERILQPGEQIRHISSIHWIVYWAGVGVTLMAAVAYWLSETRPLTRLWLYTACALALVAVALLVQEWFRWWITEPDLGKHLAFLHEPRKAPVVLSPEEVARFLEAARPQASPPTPSARS